MSKIDTADNDQLWAASHGSKADRDRIGVLEAALRQIQRQYENQNIAHVDFRIGVKIIADIALAGDA